MFTILLVICVVIIAIWFFVKRRQPAPCKCITDDRTRSSALAFAGGGFRCIVNFTGVMTGVLEVGNRSGSRPVELNTFLNKFDVINGMSGGMWFVHLMSHSKNFYDMIDKSARGEQSLFGNCDNMNSNRYSLLGLCQREGETACRNGSRTTCCCEPGYTSVNNICVKCNSEFYYTFDKWISGYSQKLEELLLANIEADLEPLGNEWLVDLITRNSDTDLYFLFILLSGKIAFSSVITQLIFDPVGDIATDMKVRDNLNGLTSTIACSASLLTTGAFYSGESDISYSFNDTSVMSWDVDLVYKPGDNSNQFGDRRLLKNPNVTYVTYISDGRNIRVDIPQKINVLDMNVRDLSTWSGSAGSLFASDIFFDDVFRDMFGTDLPPQDLISGICESVGVENCNLTASLARQYSTFAPVIRLPTDHGDTLFGDASFGHSETVYDQHVPLRMGDGALSSDLNGIVNTVYELQQNNNIGTRLKIVLFNNMPSSGLGNDVLQMFGATDDCDSAIVKDGDVDVAAFFPSVNLRKTDLQVFKRGACKKYRTIFNGGYRDSRDVLPPGYACDTLNVCDASVKIFAWEGLVTTNNEKRGIKAGYTIDLFIVGTVIPSAFNRLSAFPGDNVSLINTSEYSITANRFGQICQLVSSKIPSDVYDVVFGDEEYCQCDFKDVGDNVTYFQ